MSKKKNNTEKKSIFRSFWGVIVGLGVVLGIITSVLQIFQIFDFITLFVDAITSLYYLLFTNIPLLYAILLVIVFMVAILLIRHPEKLHRTGGNILDLDYARRIALLCIEPRSTETLRQNYNHWESQSRAIVLGGYSFDDYMKRLEEEGFLIYCPTDGTWYVTEKALQYVQKYHGYVVRNAEGKNKN